MEKARRKYSGVLAKPIKLRRLSLFDDEAAEDRRIALEMVGKLPELAKFHGIAWDGSPDAIFALMIALARTHVPGLRTERPAGAKRLLDEMELAVLRFDVEVVMADERKTIGAAIKQVMATDRWRDRLTDRTVDAIAQQLKEGAKWLRVVEDAAAFAALRKTEIAAE